jgi:hypothetical protein
MPRNRQIDELVRPAGFNIVELQTTYLAGPRPMTFTYQGIEPYLTNRRKLAAPGCREQSPASF